MKQIRFQLQNADGLHARPAGLLAKTAGGFQSKIEVMAKGQSKNAKSIMGLLSLSLERGDEIEIRAEGADEEQALAAVENLLRGGLQEGTP